MEYLKIQKQFWDLIVSGKKQYEFRKLKKGLESGEYLFVSIKEIKLCGICNISRKDKVDIDEEGNCKICGDSYDVINVPKEIYGSATLDSYGIYHFGTVSLGINGKDSYNLWNSNTSVDELCNIDSLSHKYVCKNYLNKDIEVVAYKISNVKKEGGK